MWQIWIFEMLTWPHCSKLNAWFHSSERLHILCYQSCNKGLGQTVLTLENKIRVFLNSSSALGLGSCPPKKWLWEDEVEGTQPCLSPYQCPGQWEQLSSVFSCHPCSQHPRALWNKAARACACAQVVSVHGLSFQCFLWFLSTCIAVHRQ